MYTLSTEQKVQVLSSLVEGNSIRATCRMTGTAKGTVTRLLASIGKTLENIKMLYSVIFLANSFNVMRYGHSVMQKRRMYPKTTKVNLVLGMFGPGLRWMQKLS